MLRVDTPVTTLTLSGDRSYVVGRGRDADINVPGTRVSRHHVELAPSGRGWTVRDISSNGIWVDGRRVSSLPLIPVEESRARVTAPTEVRLGAPDGPPLLLLATWPPGLGGDWGPNDADVSGMQTIIAPGEGGSSAHGRRGEPAARDAGRGASGGYPGGGYPAGAGAPPRRRGWFRRRAR
jgi:hypothetical protein